MVSTGEVNILWLIPGFFSIIAILLDSGRTAASYPESVSGFPYGCHPDYFTDFKERGRMSHSI